MDRGRGFRVANALLMAIFLAGAALQYNDPDPFLWAALYLGAAAACLLAVRGHTAGSWPALVAAVALVWAATLVPEVAQGFLFIDLFRSMKAESPAIEVNREFLGLVIVAAWMLVLTGAARRARRRA